jgi:hypothetical protein
MEPFALVPLSTMLGIRPGAKVSVLNPPSGFVTRLNPLPEGVEFMLTSPTGLDVILFFTRDKVELVEKLPALSRAMAVNGSIWVCFPAEQVHGLSEDFVRLAGLDIGLVDNKHLLLDQQWSGLRLVWRPRNPRPDKPRERKTSAEA